MNYLSYKEKPAQMSAGIYRKERQCVGEELNNYKQSYIAMNLRWYLVLLVKIEPVGSLTK